MKKSNITLIILLSLFSFQLFSQEVKVETATMKVDEMDRSGMMTELVLDKRMVEKAWDRKLRDFGDTDNVQGGTRVTDASIPGISGTVTIYSAVEKKSDKMVVFWAIDKGDGYVQQGGNDFNAAKEVLHKFGVEMYVEQINEEIEEAEDVIKSAVRDYEKLQKEGEDLQKDLEKNAEEKIDLENELKENAEDKENLLKDQDQNKKDQEKQLKEIEKLNAIKEDIKEKLKDIK